MVILDTYHISILERRGADAIRLSLRLSVIPDSAINVTVKSYEEQIRGWTAAIPAAKTGAAQVFLYERLQSQLDNYCNVIVLPHTSDAAIRREDLRKQYRRLSSPDLKIAAITLEYNAVLLTQNERHFRDIEGLKTEDWTG